MSYRAMNSLEIIRIKKCSTKLGSTLIAWVKKRTQPRIPEKKRGVVCQERTGGHNQLIFPYSGHYRKPNQISDHNHLQSEHQGLLSH
jgi:hypothetical protein